MNEPSPTEFVFDLMESHGINFRNPPINIRFVEALEKIEKERRALKSELTTIKLDHISAMSELQLKLSDMIELNYKLTKELT